ncbi:MAG: DUF2490 domain-containing protein [Prevotella sp.]|nr:DUF2490 domain-containing protein [Prevotella sp.]
MSHAGNWRKCLMIAALCLPSPLFISQVSISQAQENDFGMWYELGAEKKLSQKWNVAGEAELRTRNNARTLDRWSAGVSAEYKIAKWQLGASKLSLKASGGYTLLYDNNQEELSLKKDGVTANKWTPSYWAARHRFNISLGGTLDWHRLSIGLRERWQYTYRPEAEGKKYDIDNDEWDSVKGKGKNVLRSRLQASYDFPHWKLDPTASVEMFTAKGGTQKMRYQLGFDYKLQKQHVFSLTYRYQNVFDDDDDQEVNSHLIGLSYKYKF